MTTNTEQHFGADAIELARTLPDYRPPTERRLVHPYMPEDDSAVTRCFRDLVQRGDQMVTTIIHWEQSANALYRKLFDEDGVKREDVNLYDVFAWWADTYPEFNADYDWRKARERMAWVANQGRVVA